MWEVNVHVKEKWSTFCGGNETDSEAQKIQPKRDFGRSVHQPSPCPGEKKQPGAVVMNTNSSVRFSSVQSVQSLSRVRLFVTPWTAARQASLSITNSRSLHKPMSIESVMPSNHLILCHTLLLLPSIFPSIRVFSNGSALRIRWPKYWSSSFNSSPSNEHLGLISFRMNWLDLLAVKGLSRVFSNTTVQKHQFFCAQLSSQSNSHIHTWPLEKP